MAQDYVYPETLASTSWVAQHLNDPLVRLVETNEDALLYQTGHIPGAVAMDWFTTLQHPIRRDFLTQAAFEKLCSANGISNKTTVVFYGDKSNWFACYTFWLFAYYGHTKLKVMNGGRLKWEQEIRPLTIEIPKYPRATYTAKEPDLSIRAYRDEVMQNLEGRIPLVDVRSVQEFSGELQHMPNYPQEGAQRKGHIPGAINIPWSRLINESNGTFKPASELSQLYEPKGITPDKNVIVYCRIGERSAHTWFVLKYLLGYPAVKNYDGSWVEWGNLIDAPIERGIE